MQASEGEINGATGSVEKLSQRRSPLLAGAMVLIVAGGAALAVHSGNRPKSLDEIAFLDLSDHLAFEGRFAHANRPDLEGYDPGLPLDVLRPTAYRAPGYVWILTPLRRLGAGYPALRALNFLLVALCLAILHALVSRQAGRLAGKIGVLLVLAYPVLFYAAGTLYPQTLAALLLVTSVCLLDRLERTSRLRAYALAGLTYGALVLTVPVYLALSPIVALWLRCTRRSSSRQIALLVLALSAPAGAWMARNASVFHSPTGVATSSGFNLLAGNGPYTRHDQATADVRWPKGVRQQLIGKNEAERDRIMVGAAMASLRERPREAAELYAKKLVFWFAFRNELISDRIVPGGSGSGPPWLRDAVMAITYGLLLGILLVRLALVRSHPMQSLEGLILALYLGGGVAYAVYFTRIRFRLPFDWLLIALDAMFLGGLLAPRLRKGSFESSAAV